MAESAKIDYKPVRSDQHGIALDLWGQVFKVGRPYFQQYFEHDPWYEPGDCLGAWDSGALIGAVHVCRRPVIGPGGEVLLTGGIANVATLPSYRGRGVSRTLLRDAIALMERLGMAYSTLGTGVPAHYAALGWEDLPMPSYTVELASDVLPKPAVSSDLEGAWPTILAAYSRAPRPMQIARSPQYFEQWVGPRWQDPNTVVACRQGAYAVTNAGVGDDGKPFASVQEFRAADAASERDILGRALAQLRGYGQAVRVKARPQFCELDELESVRAASTNEDYGMMIRNIGMAPGSYEEVKAEYRSGRACWWSADNS